MQRVNAGGNPMMDKHSRRFGLMGHLTRMDLFFQEGNVQESSQLNRVSPEPPFPRDRAPPANRDRGLWGLK